MTEEGKAAVINKLKRYQWLSREIKNLESEIEELESWLIYHRSDSEIRSGSSGDNMADAVAKMVDLTEKRHRILLQRIAERDKITDAIEKLDEPEERVIMYQRYIAGKDWSEIYKTIWTKEMRSMYYVHERALEKICNNCTTLQ